MADNQEILKINLPDVQTSKDVCLKLYTHRRQIWAIMKNAQTSAPVPGVPCYRFAHHVDPSFKSLRGQNNVPLAADQGKVGIRVVDGLTKVLGRPGYLMFSDRYGGNNSCIISPSPPEKRRPGLWTIDPRDVTQTLTLSPVFLVHDSPSLDR